MNARVSVVMPALDDIELFESHLPALLAELDARGTGDEIIVVDDTGDDVLAGFLAERFPRRNPAIDVRLECVAQVANEGFAKAVLAGARAARNELLFVLNPDVRVRPGCLDPLVACLADASVFAAVPRVLLNGSEAHVESLMRLEWKDGRVAVREHGLSSSDAIPRRPIAVHVAIGGAMLVRRAEFLEAGGFDPLFLPFYWEDVDLSWTAARAGRRILLDPDSVVEHHHRGTIARRVPPEVVRAAIEKNTLLFQWKHVDDAALLEDHVIALYARALEAGLRDDRETLVGLALALEELPRAIQARGRLGRAERSFGEILRNP